MTPPRHHAKTPFSRSEPAAANGPSVNVPPMSIWHEMVSGLELGVRTLPSPYVAPMRLHMRKSRSEAFMAATMPFSFPPVRRALASAIVAPSRICSHPSSVGRMLITPTGSTSSHRIFCAPAATRNVCSPTRVTASESSTLYSSAGRRTYSKTPRPGSAFFTAFSETSTVNARDTPTTAPGPSYFLAFALIRRASSSARSAYVRSSSSSKGASRVFSEAFARKATRRDRDEARGRPAATRGRSGATRESARSACAKDIDAVSSVDLFPSRPRARLRARVCADKG